MCLRMKINQLPVDFRTSNIIATIQSVNDDLSKSKIGKFI
jgi:hypothetical protein